MEVYQVMEHILEDIVMIAPVVQVVQVLGSEKVAMPLAHKDAVEIILQEKTILVQVVVVVQSTVVLDVKVTI